jgi:glycosyltransferase involved in cell wall biosynthesis
MTTKNCKVFSVVIPVKDEAQSIPELYTELHSVLSGISSSYEILFIDDGSVDTSVRVIRSLIKKDSSVRLISFRTNFGKSQALSAGFESATGDIIVTMDADLQDNPSDIPELYKIFQNGYDLVTGWRKERTDPLNKKISSFFFNWGTSLVTGVGFHDVNCGLKIMKKEVADELFLHGELHRFIPILAVKRKFKVTEVPVHHRRRRFGKSKYGAERSWRAMIDLITTIFLTDYSSKPAHFFGKIAFPLFLVGFACDAYVTFIRLTTGTTQHHIPLLLAGILFLLLSVQLFATGLIAEMITFYQQKIEKILRQPRK